MREQKVENEDIFPKIILIIILYPYGVGLSWFVG